MLPTRGYLTLAVGGGGERRGREGRRGYIVNYTVSRLADTRLGTAWHRTLVQSSYVPAPSQNSTTD